MIFMWVATAAHIQFASTCRSTTIMQLTHTSSAASGVWKLVFETLRKFDE